MHLSRLSLVALLCGLSLTSCHRAPPPPPATPATVAAAPIFVEGEIDAAKAMRALYGAYDDKNRWSTRKQLPAAGQTDAEATRTHVAPILAEKVAEGQFERFYLVTAQTPDDPRIDFGSEGDAPDIGMAVFVREGARWRLQVHAPEMFTAGGNGEPPSAQLVQTGPARHDVLLTKGTVTQGYVIEGTLLAGLNGEKPGLLLHLLETSVENSGNCADPANKDSESADPASPLPPCYAFAIQLAWKAGPLADRYDLAATIEGQAIEKTDSGDRLVDLHGTALFRFNGTQYVAISKPDLWPDNDEGCCLRSAKSGRE